MLLTDEQYNNRSSIHLWITSRLSLFFISMCLCLGVFGITFPNYSTVIPYDNVLLDEDSTGYIVDEYGDYTHLYRLKLDFRKTACGFSNLYAFVLYDGKLKQYDWRDFEGGEKGNRKEGYHTLDLVVDLQESDVDIVSEETYLVIFTDHNCVQEDLDSVYVIKNALPALQSLDPDRINLSKVIAKIQIR